MVWQCATCESWHDGAAYFSSDAPRDPWGRVERSYRDAPTTRRYCSEKCRDAGASRTYSVTQRSGGGFYVTEHRHDGAVYVSTSLPRRAVSGPYTSEPAALDEAQAWRDGLRAGWAGVEE